MPLGFVTLPRLSHYLPPASFLLAILFASSFAEAASQELFPALGSSASSLASASGLFPGPGSSQGALGDSELLVSQTVAAASRNTSDAPASSGTSATEQATRTSDETQQRGPKEQLEALLLRSLYVVCVVSLVV